MKDEKTLSEVIDTLSKMTGKKVSEEQKAHRAVVGNAEEAHRVSAEVGNLCQCRRVCERHRVYVHRASIALTEEIHRAAVGRQSRAQILSGMSRQVGVLASLVSYAQMSRVTDDV